MYIFHFLAKKSKNWVLKFTPNFEKWLTRGKNVKSRCPLGVLVLSKCTNLIPKFQEGTITQKAKKTFQSWQKKVSKFCTFGHPGLYGAGTAKRLETALPNLAYKFSRFRGFFMQNFGYLAEF